LPGKFDSIPHVAVCSGSLIENKSWRNVEINRHQDIKTALLSIEADYDLAGLECLHEDLEGLIVEPHDKEPSSPSPETYRSFAVDEFAL